MTEFNASEDDILYRTFIGRAGEGSNIEIGDIYIGGQLNRFGNPYMFIITSGVYDTELGGFQNSSPDNPLN